MTTELSVRQALDGRPAFAEAVRGLLLGLPDGPVRQAWLMDDDLADWPLGEPAVLQALARWLRLPGRRLRLVAQGFDRLAGQAPRLDAWRRDWAHALDCLSPPPGEWPALPSLVVVGPVCIEMFDRERWRAMQTPGPAAVRHAMERIEAISQRSAPSWPLRVLGI
jgi:hypothetical protein